MSHKESEYSIFVILTSGVTDNIIQFRGVQEAGSIIEGRVGVTITEGSLDPLPMNGTEHRAAGLGLILTK